MLPDDVAGFVRTAGPEHDAIQNEMADYAAEHGFPIIGPDSGGVLRLLARLTGAERVFEFGSGYGYSAYWFLRGGADHVVLTEFDEEELEMGEEFLERAGWHDRATFEYGDAMAAIERHDGPFDVVLVDHQKHRYADAFEAVRSKVPPGSVVVADNIMGGPVDYRTVHGGLDDGLPEDAGESTRGIVEYLRRVRGDDAFETVVLPVGSGIAVSNRVD
jgi:predicted O-methyltransferase YrrM